MLLQNCGVRTQQTCHTTNLQLELQYCYSILFYIYLILLINKQCIIAPIRHNVQQLMRIITKAILFIATEALH